MKKPARRVYPSPGTYAVTTSAKVTPDEASQNLFDPDAIVACVSSEVRGPLVTYVFMVEDRKALQ